MKCVYYIFCYILSRDIYMSFSFIYFTYFFNSIEKLFYQYNKMPIYTYLHLDISAIYPISYTAQQKNQSPQVRIHFFHTTLGG